MHSLCSILDILLFNLCMPHIFSFYYILNYSSLFTKKHLKILSSQKRVGSRGVSIDSFRLPSPSLMFFEHLKGYLLI